MEWAVQPRHATARSGPYDAYSITRQRCPVSAAEHGRNLADSSLPTQCKVQTPVIGWHFKTFVYFEMEFLLIFQLHLLRGAKPSHWWNRYLILKKIVEIEFPSGFFDEMQRPLIGRHSKKIANFECLAVLEQGEDSAILREMVFHCLSSWSYTGHWTWTSQFSFSKPA